MTRILMRAQMQHDSAFTPETVLLENLMGGNNGNWLYQYSLFRTLMVDDSVKIDIFNANKQTVDDAFIRKVNEKYDYFVIPLANAFKKSFTKELKTLTKMVKKLKIPCIVIGVGIQMKLGKDFFSSYDDKDIAKDFVKAVLEKSSMIGVRGEATGDFLKYLGFKEEQDYTVTGCPSLYLYGSELPRVKPFVYGDEATFLYHSKVEHENEKVLTLMNNIVREHPNYIYSPQRLGDMIKSYFGTDYRDTNEKTLNRFFDNSKTVCFTSPYMWTKYLSENVDLSFGTRFHGSVAAVLSGVPSFIVATDQRVSELASYHNIAHITIDDTDDTSTIRKLIENVDFNRIHQGHEYRFNHFVDFLQKNELNNIYSKDRSIKHAYFDDVLKSLDFSDDVLAFDAVSSDIQLKRTKNAAEFYSGKFFSVQKQLKEEKTQTKELKKTLKETKKEVTTLKESEEQKQAEIDALQANVDALTEETNKGFFKKIFK